MFGSEILTVAARQDADGGCDRAKEVNLAAHEHAGTIVLVIILVAAEKRTASTLSPAHHDSG